MTSQWLQMRIAEEKERRERERLTLERLPRALEELHVHMAACVEEYRQAFGREAADINMFPSRIKVIVREQHDGKWQQAGKVEVTIVPALPGFQIDHGAEPVLIELGLLTDDKVSYRDREHDQYLGIEELTRRILDRSLFPKLAE